MCRQYFTVLLLAILFFFFSCSASRSRLFSNSAAVRVLVEGKADINVQNQAGATALQWSVSYPASDSGLSCFRLLWKEPHLRTGLKDSNNNNAVTLALEKLTAPADRAMAESLRLRHEEALMS